MNKKLLAAWIAVLAGQAAWAEEPLPLRFSGFGTLGLNQSDNREADFRASAEQTEGTGRTHKHDSGADSRFGVQMDYAMAPTLSATVQVLSKKLSDNTSTPGVEWANLKWQFSPDAFVRVGRVVAPMFMISDSRAVGYAQTMLRTPTDVYFLNPITNLNGADAGLRFEAGDVSYKLGIAKGSLNQSLKGQSGVTNYEFDNTMLNGSAEFGGSTVRLGYARVDIKLGSDTLNQYQAAVNGLAASGLPGAQTIKDNVGYEDLKGDFYNIGYTYDKGSYLLQAEYARRVIPTNTIQDAHGFYVMGGYRRGKWTPYISYSQTKANEDYNLPVLTSPGAATAQAVALVNGVNKNFQLKLDSRTFAIGARYDLMENVAIKAQVERIDKPEGAGGSVINQTPAFLGSEQTINLYSATLDFVF